MKKIGYARVSTLDQNPAMQLAALQAAGCSKVYQDEASGADPGRAGLQEALASLEEGDTFTVWKIDRLGRSVAQIIDVLDDLRGRGVVFQSITEAIDTGSPFGRAVWQIIAVMAELERGVMLERTRAGLDAARARGVRLGRPPSMTPTEVRQAVKLLAADESPEAVAASFKVSRATLYRYIAAERITRAPRSTLTPAQVDALADYGGPLVQCFPRRAKEDS